MKLSIIIVNYQSAKKLFVALKSIFGQKIKSQFEVIVVDNDQKSKLKKRLQKEYPGVKYFFSGSNLGFGAGCNRGARETSGQLLFFLNPDTQLLPGALEELIQFFSSHPQAGIVAPLLLDKNRQPFSKQGTAELSPLTAFFALSAIDHLWPTNPFSKRYWLTDWDKKRVQEVAVVPGTAFMIKKDIFHQVAGFDENFFLYFEESDLCRRVSEAGWQVFFQPRAKVIHYWPEAKKKSRAKKKIFQQSRYYFFKKHYHSLIACLVEGFLRLWEG